MCNDIKCMGELHFIWEDDNMPLIIKVKSHDATPLNLLLWGGDNWSGNAAGISECEAFYHQEMRRILIISMARVKDDMIRNNTIIKYFLNEPSIEDARRIRQLLFSGRASRMKNNAHPKILFSETVNGIRSRGRQYRAFRDSMVENINLIVPNVEKDGRIYRWMRHSKEM